MRLIDADKLLELMKDQKEREIGAYTKGINAHCLLHRKDMGWTIEEILTTPLRGKRNVKC